MEQDLLEGELKLTNVSTLYAHKNWFWGTSPKWLGNMTSRGTVQGGFHTHSLQLVRVNIYVVKSGLNGSNLK